MLNDIMIAGCHLSIAGRGNITRRFDGRSAFEEGPVNDSWLGLKHKLSGCQLHAGNQSSPWQENIILSLFRNAMFHASQ